jgi:UDP-N-acetyl-2-amino-2-deoxyglucuronate dehydrogenase
MMTRRTSTLLIATAPAFGLFQGRTAVGFITDPSGPHLQIYLDSLRSDAVGEIAIADATGTIFDRSKKTLSPRQIRTFRDPGEMLQTTRPQLVLVALEARLAPAAIRLALEHNAHVLAEKPACVRASDFAPLVELAKRRKRNLMLAFATRLHPVCQRARALITANSIGRPLGVSAHYIADQTRLTRPDYQHSWFASRDRAGGGHLAWLGIHYVDLIQFITGEHIVEVSAQTANVGGQPVNIEDSAAVSFRLSGGGVGTLQSAYYLDRGYHNGITIWGSDGWVRFDPSGDRVEWYRRDGEAKTEMLPKVESYPELVRAAAEAARGVRDPIVTAPECLRALRVVFTAYESAHSRRILTVEPVTRE